jgi:hypothetical protein
MEQQNLEEKIICNIENKKWIHNTLYKNAKKKAEKRWFKREKTTKINWTKKENIRWNKREKRLEKIAKNTQEKELENSTINPFYYVEIDNTIKGNFIPGKYKDDYQQFKIVGRVVDNENIPFKAECGIRTYDGENLLIYSVSSGKNKDNSFYKEINTTEKEFNFVISNIIPFPLKFTAFSQIES